MIVHDRDKETGWPMVVPNDDGIRPAGLSEPNKRYTVLVTVEVLVTVDPAFGLHEAAKMALEASSHNQFGEESSVLDVPGYGTAEVVKQTISYAIRMANGGKDVGSTAT